MKKFLIILAFFLLVFQVSGSFYPGPSISLTLFEEDTLIGPASGSLVIVGGAMRDTTIALRFIELAGGMDAPIVVIPTAGGQENPDPERSIRFLTRLGATNVQMVHTSDPKIADTDEFVKPIREAKGVWFGGGRQWRIVDAYGGTLTETEFRKVLDRGGVIGGSSAGATIQGTYLARGDTKTNIIMMGDHERGFDYLKKSAIDQHLLKRNRQFDLIEIIRAHPDLLGIGLDENTAIVVQGNIAEVIGQSYVAIFDYNRWEENLTEDSETILENGGKFFLLAPGDRFDLYHRKAVHLTGGDRGVPVLK
jgi:cyanophycinase